MTYGFETGQARQGRQSGFTLLELMVVIVILGLLATLVSVNVMGRVEKAKKTTARTQIAMLHNAVNQYKLDTGKYPDSSVGLDALVVQPPGVENWNKDGYLEGVRQIPKDPWGNEYFYVYPGERGKFDIYSLGPSGKEGGEGDDAPIYDSDVAGGESGSTTRESVGGATRQ
jgi:general secretion pathway protein G